MIEKELLFIPVVVPGDLRTTSEFFQFSFPPCVFHVAHQPPLFQTQTPWRYLSNSERFFGALPKGGQAPGIIDRERGGPQQTIAARSGLVVNLYSDIACPQSWQWSGKTGCVGREGNGERSAIARGGASLGDKATTEGEVDYGQTKAGIGKSAAGNGEAC